MSEPTSKNAIVVVGATGDLCRYKLMPSLSALFAKKILDDSFVIVGVGRGELSDSRLRSLYDLPPGFLDLLRYHRGITGLGAFLSSLNIHGRIIVFFALPPEAYPQTAREVHAEDLGSQLSIVIEKPFGRDFVSARELNRQLALCFPEPQIWRIDHYLAKEVVQNILVFRFANALFEPVWNADHIESIQISGLETDGIKLRSSYFDSTGIIRDMVQNHLLQLLSMLTMEPPAGLEAGDIRYQKISVLKSMTVDSAAIFQYDGYTAEAGIATDSRSETFAELKLSINNSRWAGVPVYIRAGKATNRAATEIGVQFKKTAHPLFNKYGAVRQNRIIFRVQPVESIMMDVVSKVPGTDTGITNTLMRFCYHDAFGATGMQDAYQRLLIDIIRGDKTLFVSALETEQAWKIIDPVFELPLPLSTYARGTLPVTGSGFNWIDFESYGCG